METLLPIVKDLIIEFLDIILLLFGSAFVTLGIVYMTGRMLEILNSHKTRNLLAIFSIYGIHYAYTYLTFSEKIYESQLERGWDVFIRGSISIVIYVLFCWRLFDRIDKFFDKKIGEDNGEPEIPPEPKKRKRRKNK